MDRANYWRKFETKRITHERYGILRIAKGLQDQIETVKEILPEAGAPALLAGLDQFLKTEPLQVAYQDLYGRVGGDFARDSFRDLSGKSIKAEDDWIEFMRSFAITEAGNRIRMVSDVTLNRIRRVLQQGIDEGLGIEEIARRMENSNAVNRIRARVIARTEIVSASNRGSLLGAQSTGLTLNKEWITSQDSNVRTYQNSSFDHAESDGDVVASNEPFIVSGEELEYPGDPRGSAGNVINCRCTIGHIPI